MSAHELTRRGFIRMALAAPIVFAAGWKLRGTELLAQAAAREPRLETTPACEDDDDPTPPMTAGPFFKPRSPKRSSLIEPGLQGTPIVVEGQVFARDCRPVGRALLDFWHADGDGEYDLEGYRLRGHLFTDAQGRYRLTTILPGEYPGRTRHIHVRVQAPKGRILTTQLFFPGEDRNRRDGLFHPDLLLRMGERSGRKVGQFHFVLDRA